MLFLCVCVFGDVLLCYNSFLIRCATSLNSLSMPSKCNIGIPYGLPIFPKNWW